MAFIIGLAIGFVIQRFAPLHFLTSSAGIDALQIVGASLVLAAVGLAGWAFFCFWRLRTSPLPERPTSALVIVGPFRFTRNPLYLAMALVHAGAALFSNAVWPLLLLAPAVFAIRILVIAREERYLLERFGQEYAAYCRSVRRWI